MNIYKFTKNTVELSQYYKNIDSIRSIIIIGNTCGLCGWFKLIENDKWEELVPDPDLDASSDAGYINIKRVFPTLINNKAEIVIVCDNEDTKTYWETVYHYFCVLMDKDEIRNFKMIDSIKENKDYETVMKSIKTNVEKRKHKFDVGFINAPYDGKLHEKFESMMFDLCNDEIVWVGPTTWLLGKKQSKVLTEPIDKCHAEIQSIKGTDYFDAGISGNMGITYINKNADDTYTVFDKKVYNKCSEIRAYCNDELFVQFKQTVSDLFHKCNMQQFVKRIPNVHTFGNALEEHNPNLDWWIYRLTRFSVHPDGKHTNWCIHSKNRSNIYKFSDICNVIENPKNNNMYLKYYIPFTEKYIAERANNYTTGMFCRACLYLIQTSYELGRGELSYIPWFDFSDPMFAGSPEDIDVALFRKYGISQQIVDHILEILPNYYNLDLTKYKNI